LTEDERRVLEDIGLGHLHPEVVALAGALADAGKYRRTTEVAGDAGDHLLDEHRLADTGTTEQSDLATLDVRGEQVEHLDTGFQHLGRTLELVERRRLTVDGPPVIGLDLRRVDIQRFAERVEHVTLDAVADRYRNRLAGVD